MNKLVALIIILSVNFTNAQHNIPIEDHIKNQNDVTKRDNEMFNYDINNRLNHNNILPLTPGVFPVAKYKYFGGEDAFKGGGSSSNKVDTDFGSFVFTSFFINKNELSKSVLKEKNELVFFNIGVLIDTIYMDVSKQFMSSFVSRNHPDMIGQGSLLTKYSKIDFVSFFNYHNQDSYAIVNMKLLDLSFGNTILIYPLSDGSFRFFQYRNEDYLTRNNLEKFNKSLFQKTEVKNWIKNIK
ncbi:MAG: hypothetical protein ACR2MS_12610 [Weeksellaceae bacterium]